MVWPNCLHPGYHLFRTWSWQTFPCGCGGTSRHSSSAGRGWGCEHGDFLFLGRGLNDSSVLGPGDSCVLGGANNHGVAELPAPWVPPDQVGLPTTQNHSAASSTRPWFHVGGLRRGSPPSRARIHYRRRTWEPVPFSTAPVQLLSPGVQTELEPGTTTSYAAAAAAAFAASCSSSSTSYSSLTKSIRKKKEKKNTCSTSSGLSQGGAGDPTLDTTCDRDG
ncbi:UNVERIFIED_CONTAM: hypothetical protein FKN15_019881 [Acipenser sinensis]